MTRAIAPFRPAVESLEDRLTPYVLSGYQWGTTALTASFVPDGVTAPSTYGSPTTNLFSVLDSRFETATWQREFARALQTWANASRLNFTFVADSGTASGSSGAKGDIRIAMIPRTDSAAASAFYPTGSSLAGDVFMSSNYTWQIGQHLDIYSVALHELGHSLGLRHSDVGGSIMAPTIGTVYAGLSADDIAGIQAIYGARQHDSYDSGAGNNTLATASAISLNSSGAASFKADLTSMLDLDHYRFTAPSNSNGSLTVSVSAAGLSLLNPKVLVYDASGNLLGSATATTYGGTATLNLSGITAGKTYYVVADGATADEFGMGAYSLSTQFGQGSAPSSPSLPSVSVGSASALEGNSGSKQFAFAVSLSAASTQTVTVNYATADGTAAAGSDYQAASGTVTFAPGETQKTVVVTVYGDTAVEADETFSLRLSSPANATLGTSQGTGTILNDDSSGGSAASFVGSNGSSRGNWSQVSGADGYSISQGSASVPSYARVSLGGNLNHTWAGSTADSRALQKPGSADRLAATWYSSTSFTVDVSLTDGQTHRVSAYFLDWDRLGRVQTVEVLDATTGAVLDARTVSDFSGGTYLTWDLSGSVRIRVTNAGGLNAVLSGLFFGSPADGSGNLNLAPEQTGGTTGESMPQAEPETRRGSRRIDYQFFAAKPARPDNAKAQDTLLLSDSGASQGDDQPLDFACGCPMCSSVVSIPNPGE